MLTAAELRAAELHLALEREVEAYFNGYGHVPTLLARLREAPLGICVDAAGHAVTVTGAPGVTPQQWRALPAFSEFDACRAFAADHQPASRPWTFLHLTGAALLDEFLPGFHAPTALFLNPAGRFPFLLPPTTEFLPQAPWAIDLSDPDTYDV